MRACAGTRLRQRQTDAPERDPVLTHLAKLLAADPFGSGA